MIALSHLPHSLTFDAPPKLYPNPTSDILHISHQLRDIVQKWRIINTLGQTIWQTRLSSFERLDSIVLSHYPAGIYWLEIQANGLRHTRKIIIQ